MSASKRKQKNAIEGSSRSRDQYDAMLARGIDEATARDLSGWRDEHQQPLPSDPLSLWTHNELRELARRSGIRNPNTLSRDELIDLLSEQKSRNQSTQNQSTQKDSKA